MSEIEAILIVIASIVGVLVVIVGLVWGISAYARAQRQTRVGRTEEYLPPPPLPARQGTLGAEEYPRIRWGPESHFSEQDVERVHFSDIEQDEEYEETSYSSSLIAKCLVCQRQIDERESKAITCPKCQANFHQHCWEYMSNKCSNCE